MFTWKLVQTWLLQTSHIFHCCCEHAKFRWQVGLVSKEQEELSIPNNRVIVDIFINNLQKWNVVCTLQKSITSLLFKKHKINRISFHSTTSKPYPSFHFRSLKNLHPITEEREKEFLVRSRLRLERPRNYEASLHSLPPPPLLVVRSFIVPSLFAWPLIRPLSVPLRHRYRSGGTSSGPESAFNNGSPFSWVQS